MTGKKRRTIPIILLAVVFLLSVGMMIRQQFLYRQIISDSDEAAQIAGLPARSHAPSAPIEPEPDMSPEEPLEALPEAPPETLPEEVTALTGFCTIAYAHRIRNDTMFGALKYYKDLDFWQERPCVYSTTEAGVYCYEIFAAQEAGIKEIVYRLDIEESGLEEEFLRYCMEGSVIDTGITPEAGDRILTLSTCTGNGHAKRWVVHAVLRDIWAIE